jgi:hypothetical protein
MRKARDVRYKIGSRVIRLQSFSFIVPLALLFMLAACGSTTTTGAGSTPTSAPGSGATTVPGKTTVGCPNRAVVTPLQKVPNVTLHVANSHSTSSARQGDLIEVQLPFGRQWSGPTTSQGALELQSPYGYANDTLKMCIWQFVAKGAGTAHLNFSGRPICLPGQLCPQYIQDVPFIIEVK